VRAIDDDAVETGLAAALSHPPLDLRQGGYAVRRATGIDAIWLTRIAAMAGLVLLVSVLISIVTIARLHYESASLDAKTVALAKDVVPDARDAVDANARLAAVVAQRGGGATFTGIAAGIMGAMQGAPGVTMTSLSQLADGTVRVQLSGSRAEDINMVLIALQNAGWRIAANAVQQQGAQVVADISVVPS
jgi:general secretion pathway protein L